MNSLTLILAVFSAVSGLAASIAAPVCSTVEPAVTVSDNGIVFTSTVEDYVACVVAGEMPYTFEEEALKAQAVAARTYMYYCLDNGCNSHKDADLCTDASHCSSYMTEEKLEERFGSEYAKEAMHAARSAANATKGEILTYDKAPLLAVWHSSSDGYTEDSGNVWLASLPYLSPQKTPEKAEQYTISFTLTEARNRLRAAGYKYNGKTNLVQYNTRSGRCDTLSFGNVEISGNDARRVFGLKSTDFTASYHDGRLYFFVRGYGHGVGMSQYGANEFAKNGLTYREILAHYYNGSTLSYIR